MIKESHGLVPTPAFLYLMHKAESAVEVENVTNGTVFSSQFNVIVGLRDSGKSTILLLHLLPPSAQGR